MTKNDGYTLVRAIMQKERRELLGHLFQGKKNISDLANLTGLDRATVSYHLGVLEHNKIVTSEYQMLTKPASMGKIGRYYSIHQDGLDLAIAAIKRLSADMQGTKSSA